MPHKSRKDANGQTVADKILDKYKAWIAEEFYKEYGLGSKDTDLKNHEDKKAAWMDLHTWSVAKEGFVINRTKVFIRLLDSKDSNSTNLQFIKALVNRIAGFLTKFCANCPGRSVNKTNSMLKDALYSKNSYVRGLELYQQERRKKAQPRTQQVVAEKRKRERITANQKKRDMENQVHIMFVEVSTYRKK